MAYQIGEDSGRLDGRFKHVYNGEFMLDEFKFSKETQALIRNLLRNDYTITEFRKYDLDQIIKIVEEEMKIKPLYRDNLNDTDYNADFSVYINPYITRVINEITNQRNKIINNPDFSEKSLRGLDNLAKSAEYLANCNLKHNGSVCVSNAAKERAAQLAQIIRHDIEVLPQYRAQEKETRERYLELKAQYDRKSTFGRFIARFTGEEKEVTAARLEASRYDMKDITDIERPAVINDGGSQYQFTDIKDPKTYPEMEVSNEGRSR